MPKGEGFNLIIQTIKNIPEERIAYVNKTGMLQVVWQFVHNKYPEFKITIDCLNQVLNSYTIQFYEQVRIKIIIFSHHIHIKEVF